MPSLVDDLARWAERARTAAEDATMDPSLREVGTVERIGDGVATVLGLKRARADELLRFSGGILGTAVTLEPDRIGAVLLGPWQDIAAGSEVAGTGEVVRVPVGEELLGRVVDPLGRPLDGGAAPACRRTEPVERPAPGIVERALVSRPLATGITVIDAMLPIGRGQRELIIGDRKTGKTAIAVDAILNQTDGEVVCVYAAIGQKTSTVGRVIDTIARLGPKARTVVVVAEASGPTGLAWIAPYAACTMAEYFSERGRDVLLVLDDLTKHAAIHREVSLLLRRPPGREAYPGDVFYAHSRLLERGAHLSDERGGGSLTILPIAETQGGNLTAYIPTNLISITDGQIILDPKLFNEGQKPAINVGLSVSRVGGKAQAQALKGLAGSLRLDYTQFLELEMFTRFGGMADERTRAIVEHGRRIRQMLIQANTATRPLAEQVAGLLALGEGLLDRLAPAAVDAFKDRLAGRLAADCADIAGRIHGQGALSDADRALLRDRLAAMVAAEAT
jgi:F-type H+-transporting ATPase subunit alpha